MNILMDSSSSTSSDEEVIRRPKWYKPRKNYVEIYDELDFYERFRLSKATFNLLLQQVEEQLQPRTRKGGSIQPVIKLLLTLRFYATGSMQQTVGDFCGVSTSSASRIIKQVSESIAMLAPNYIKMDETPEQMQRTAENFYNIARFPRVVGAIDCTLIKIQSPGGEDAEVFRTRKHFFGINVQTVSDSKMYIRDIVASWPGSTHDQTIFNNSYLKRRFEMGQFGKYILLGDSGYKLKHYLMTKLLNVQTASETLYNESIIRTRNVVERQYGIWKRRFPILQKGIALKLETTLSVIVATAVLHNIALDQNEEVINEWEIQDEHEIDENENAEHGDPSAQLTRRNLIVNHFGQM